MQTFLLALSFLTSLPIKTGYTATKEQMTRSLAFYPLVGLTLGGIVTGVAWVGKILDLAIAGDVLTVIVLIALTGGLHLDGLMDTADGLLSGQPKEKKLEIMRDTNAGAMGAIVLVSHLFLKITLLSVLPWSTKYKILILMPTVGRWAMVYAIANYPYARKKPGLGDIFNRQGAKEMLIIAGVILLLATWVLMGVFGMLALGISIILIYFCSKKIAKSLGGQTGDTYGAIGEISELTFLLIAVLITNSGMGVN